MVTVSDFKARASDWLRRIAHPLVITQNGKPAGVLLSPAAFDELSETAAVFLRLSKKAWQTNKQVAAHTTDEVLLQWQRGGSPPSKLSGPSGPEPMSKGKGCSIRWSARAMRDLEEHDGAF